MTSTRRPVVRRRAGTEARATPQLARIIREVTAAASRRPTLSAVRAEVQQKGMTWSQEGELLFPQDRTALLIELDELIERSGARAPAADFIASGLNGARP